MRAAIKNVTNALRTSAAWIGWTVCANRSGLGDSDTPPADSHSDSGETHMS